MFYKYTVTLCILPSIFYPQLSTFYLLPAIVYLPRSNFNFYLKLLFPTFYTLTLHSTFFLLPYNIFYILHPTFYILPSALYILLSTFYPLHFAFCVLNLPSTDATRTQLCVDD